jgi:hypothetical protein
MVLAGTGKLPVGIAFFGAGLAVVLLGSLSLREAYESVEWPLLVMLGALIMIHHLAFASSALQLAAAAIAREKQARTWESLLLTGVDARRIIVGKWWATMQTLWADFRLLVPLRFGVALWLGVAQRIVHLNPFFVAPTLPVIILISVVVAVFPLIYAAFSAVVGLLAALITNSETSAARLGSLLHFGTIALSFAALMLVISLPFAFELGRGADPAVAALLPGVFVTPLDGGMLSLVGMITGGAGEGVSGVYLVGLALCTLLYALLTGAALWAATRLAVRLRVTPP